MARSRGVMNSHSHHSPLLGSVYGGGSVVWTDRQRGRKGKKTTVSASYCISMCFVCHADAELDLLAFFFEIKELDLL